MKRLRLMLFTTMILTSFFLSLVQTSANGGDGKVVFYIPVEQAVERGLLAFLERSIETAIEEGADHIVFEVNTPGGFVDAAGEIADLIGNVPIPTTAFVVKDALSAGAYISLYADEIVMVPGMAEIGAAQVIDGSGSAADDKAHSAWLAKMRNAAERNGRDPIYALAMADPEIDLPEYNAGTGKLLTLTASQAYEVGYADALAEDRAELLQYLDLENAVEREMEVSFAEKIARFVTHPIIIPILLSIGSLGLVLELYSPGFGIPGIMGITALMLYFFGHLVAGFAGFETMILFAAGIILLLIEIFMPGFGIFGILGIGAMIGSLILASYSTSHILVSILIAAAVTIAVSIIMFKYFGNRGPLRKLVLTEAITTAEGYVSNINREDIVGKAGEALTTLRPSGTALIDNERLDVVSEGGYIEQGKKVKVISASGSRIVVREHHAYNEE
ncbi:membrane-bound serine protease (ClpP class) [Evansella caseinilytica]|uniref:Membrane-bound serine protease (ClpP class) n=1 Tax=Evansella caseinilytica TaxID=1503961 RepID=A0A1H3KHW4_9BACI|nr:nodulation protein NfeD [Evansella caseinilytica]SDY51737.1 membrane-bound serine protease (ClpP class) [Evansella caseinilytica]